MNEEALTWVIRTRDPHFSDWEAFTLWLEADPSRAVAYDALMAADADLDAIVPPEPVTMPVAANDPGTPSRRNFLWLGGGGAIAAALVAAISIGTMNQTDIYTVATRAGETRTVTLKDGTRIDLNGGTKLRLDHANPRFAALDAGEAAFTVRHDAADPFQVTVGDAVFEDAGTVFNIVRANNSMRIGVSEGKVIYNPEAEAIALPAGRALSEDAQGLHVMDVAPAAVASWRQGQLIYANAPAGDVSEDIARSLGVRIDMTPGARATRFTGTIRLDRDPAQFFAKAAPLMGLSALRQGDAWLLKEGDGPKS